MKNLFKKNQKAKSPKVKTISKTELENIVGGADILSSDVSSSIKISPEKQSSFFHS